MRNAFSGREQFYIELGSTHDILIEGCAGIIEYSDTVIRLSLGMRVLLISGSELAIKSMFGETVTIGGNISAVEFI